MPGRTLKHFARRTAVVVLGIAVVAGLSAGAYLARQAGSGQDLVRIRNALLFDVRHDDVYDWGPGSVPSDYLEEAAPPPEEFRKLVGTLLSDDAGRSTMEKSLTIARHLVRNSNRPAIPIQSKTQQTYSDIQQLGRGYCADYTQVLNALMYTAGIAIREWGMSFDRYGGEGHAFNEIFDPALAKWVFFDSFYSFYVTDGNGSPLSASEFRDTLLDQRSAAINVVPINADKFSFKTAERAIEYYRRGADSFYMWWGTNALSNENNGLLNMMSALSRSAEQLSAIALGLHPKLVIADSWKNPGGIRELRKLKFGVFVAVLSILAGGLALLSLLTMRLFAAKTAGPQIREQTLKSSNT